MPHQQFHLKDEIVVAHAPAEPPCPDVQRLPQLQGHFLDPLPHPGMFPLLGHDDWRHLLLPIALRGPAGEHL